MTQTVVLTSLTELGTVRSLFPQGGPIPAERALVPVVRATGPAEREALDQEAGRALGELRELLARDGARRREAARALDRLRAASFEAERLRGTARDMGEAAERAFSLARSAIDRAARERAASVAATAGRLRTRAEAHAEALRREARALAEREDVAHLLAEERARREEMKVREKLERATRHLDGGRNEEARRLLASLERSVGGVAGLAGEFEALRRRERAAHLRAAEGALTEARRLHRREPARAIELIEAVELEGLPEETARHLYGCWLTACRRLGLLAAIHYRAGSLRGAVLIPTADGRWKVVSQLGLRRWEQGRTFSPRALRGARPLG